MKPSNFTYLENEYPILFNLGKAAEFNLHTDPTTCMFKLRQLGEKITELVFEEHYLEFPYENSFHTRLKTLYFEKIIPERVNDLFHTLKNKGNKAVHDADGTLNDAKMLLFATFKITKWFYQAYSNDCQVYQVRMN